MRFDTGQTRYHPLTHYSGGRIDIEKGREFCGRQEGADEWIDLERQISASYS